MTDVELERESEDYADWYWGASPSALRAIKGAYIAGAEAHSVKWHCVKDGEYPTHSYRVLVLTDEGVGFGIYGQENKKVVYIRYRV